jgi:hypothetical protein
VSWLPEGFEHPTNVDLPTGHRLRPIRATDIDIDFPAVMGSQARLWSIFGELWGWPPAGMTRDHDLEDLARHEREIEAHESFNYAVLTADGTELKGCVYIDPCEDGSCDALVTWWVTDDAVGTDLESALDELVPHWMATAWPFRDVRYGL